MCASGIVRREERRSAVRFPVTQPITVIPTGQWQTGGFTRNISSEGILFYTTSKIDVGTQVEMLLLLPTELFAEGLRARYEGRVVRLQEEPKSGHFGVAVALNRVQIM